MGKNDTIIQLALYLGCIVLVIILNLVYFKMAKNIMDEAIKGGKFGNKKQVSTGIQVPVTNQLKLLQAQTQENNQMTQEEFKEKVKQIAKDVFGIEFKVNSEKQTGREAIYMLNPTGAEYNDAPEIDTKKENLTAETYEYYKNKYREDWTKNGTLKKNLDKLNKTLGGALPAVELARISLQETSTDSTSSDSGIHIDPKKAWNEAWKKFNTTLQDEIIRLNKSYHDLFDLQLQKQNPDLSSFDYNKFINDAKKIEYLNTLLQSGYDYSNYTGYFNFSQYVPPRPNNTYGDKNSNNKDATPNGPSTNNDNVVETKENAQPQPIPSESVSDVPGVQDEKNAGEPNQQGTQAQDKTEPSNFEYNNSNTHLNYSDYSMHFNITEITNFYNSTQNFNFTYFIEKALEGKFGDQNTASGPKKDLIALASLPSQKPSPNQQQSNSSYSNKIFNIAAIFLLIVVLLLLLLLAISFYKRYQRKYDFLKDDIEISHIAYHNETEYILLDSFELEKKEL